MKKEERALIRALREEDKRKLILSAVNAYQKKDRPGDPKQRNENNKG